MSTFLSCACMYGMICTNHDPSLHVLGTAWLDIMLSQFLFLIFIESILIRFRIVFVISLNYLSCVWNPFRLILAPTKPTERFPRSLQPPKVANLLCVWLGSNEKASSQRPCAGERVDLRFLVLGTKRAPLHPAHAWFNLALLMATSAHAFVVQLCGVYNPLASRFSLFYKNYTFLHYSPLPLHSSDPPLTPSRLSFLTWLLILSLSKPSLGL